MCCTKCLSNTNMYSCVKGVTEAYCDAKHTVNWDMYTAIWIHSQTHSDTSHSSPLQRQTDTIYQMESMG